MSQSTAICEYFDDNNVNINDLMIMVVEIMIIVVVKKMVMGSGWIFKIILGSDLNSLPPV